MNRIPCHILLTMLFASLFLGNCKNNRPIASCGYIINDAEVYLEQADSLCKALDALQADSLNLNIFIGNPKRNNRMEAVMNDFRKRTQIEKRCNLIWDTDKKEMAIIYSDALKTGSYLQKRHDFGRYVYDRIKEDKIESSLMPVIKKFKELFTATDLLNIEGTDLEKY